MTKSVCISVTNTLQIIDGPTQNSKLIEGYAQKNLQKYSEIFSISRRSLPRLTHVFIFWNPLIICICFTQSSNNLFQKNFRGLKNDNEKWIKTDNIKVTRMCRSYLFDFTRFKVYLKYIVFSPIIIFKFRLYNSSIKFIGILLTIVLWFYC